MSETWLSLGKHFEPSGHHAYTLEKSAAYSCMAEESRRLFELVGGRWPAEGETLFDYIRHLCMKQQRSVIFQYQDHVYNCCLHRLFGEKYL